MDIVGPLVPFAVSLAVLAWPVAVLHAASRLLGTPVPVTDNLAVSLFSLVTLTGLGHLGLFRGPVTILVLTAAALAAAFLFNGFGGWRGERDRPKGWTRPWPLLLLPSLAVYLGLPLVLDPSSLLFLGVSTPAGTVAPVALSPFGPDGLNNYLPVARSVVEARGFSLPTVEAPYFVYGPPLTTATLAHVFGLTGFRDGAALGVVFALVLVSASSLRGLFRSERPGFYAACLLLLVSPFALNNLMTLKEDLLLLSATGLLALKVRDYLGGDDRSLVPIALLCGLLPLVKESGFVISLVTVLFLAPRVEPDRRTRATGLLAVSFLPVAFWATRNLLIYGNPMFPLFTDLGSAAVAKGWYHQRTLLLRLLRNHVYALPVLLPGLVGTYRYRSRFSLFVLLQMGTLFLLSFVVAFPNPRYYVLPLLVPLAYFGGRAFLDLLPAAAASRPMRGGLALIVILLLASPVAISVTNDVSQEWSDQYAALEHIEGSDRILILGDGLARTFHWYSDATIYDSNEPYFLYLFGPVTEESFRQVVTQVSPERVIYLGDSVEDEVYYDQFAERYVLVKREGGIEIWVPASGGT